MISRLMLGACVVSLLAASCQACQHVPEEPVQPEPAFRPAASPPKSSVVATNEQQATIANEPPPVPTVESGIPPGRCVRPLSEKPPRPMPRKPDPSCPRDPEGGPPKLATGVVDFAQAGVKVSAELARTEHQITRGLMYRKEMADGEGMLFYLDERRVAHFWMHNTCIPLDLIFIDDDGLIVGIEENAPTLNDDDRSCGCPGPYVLEVNAGWARKHGVLPGQRVTLPR